MLKKITVTGLMLLTLIACSPNKTQEPEPETKSPSPKLKVDDANIVLLDKKIKSFSISTEQSLYFDTEVTDVSVALAISSLEDMKKNTSKDLYLFINSPGGSVFDGNRLVTYIENSKRKIHTVCVTVCASMAAHLHQAGSTRLMLDNSMLMFHPAAGGARGQVENMRSLLNTIQLMVDRMDAKITKRSGLDYKEFKAKVAFEYWVLAEDAVRSNLSESIVNISTGDSLMPFGQTISETAMKKGIKIQIKKQIEVPTVIM